MRLQIIAILLVTLMLAGCGKSDGDSVTPQQAAQLEQLRQATIAGIEKNLHRPLSEDEKNCVVTKLDHGRLRGYIKPPLSHTLERMNPVTRPTNADQTQILPRGKHE